MSESLIDIEIKEISRNGMCVESMLLNHTHYAIIACSAEAVRVEDVADPTMRKIRYLDKLVDELAKGKNMQSILRVRDS